jgi:hypothetical protein
MAAGIPKVDKSPVILGTVPFWLLMTSTATAPADAALDTYTMRDLA